MCEDAKPRGAGLSSSRIVIGLAAVASGGSSEAAAARPPNASAMPKIDRKNRLKVEPERGVRCIKASVGRSGFVVKGSRGRFRMQAPRSRRREQALADTRRSTNKDSD